MPDVNILLLTCDISELCLSYCNVQRKLEKCSKSTLVDLGLFWVKDELLYFLSDLLFPPFVRRWEGGLVYSSKTRYIYCFTGEVELCISRVKNFFTKHFSPHKVDSIGQHRTISLS